MAEWTRPAAEMHSCQRCGRMKWMGGLCECATPEELEKNRRLAMGEDETTERRGGMTLDKIPTGPIETELHKSFDELTDKMLVATFNAARKKRLKMNVDSEIVDAELRVAGDLVEGRDDTYLSSEGWAAVVEEEQQSLFATPIGSS